MELTLKIPKRLVFRLKPHTSQLDKILELGLDALEAADQISTEPEMGDALEEDIPTSWRLAARTFSERLEATSELPAPSPAELTAYLEGDLEAAEAESLRDRLLEHPKALEELLVMDEPGSRLEHLEGSEDDGIEDSEVGLAWEQLQVRLAAQREQVAESTTALPSSHSPDITPESVRPRAQGLPGPSRLRPWLSLAAGLLLTTLSFGASSVYHGRLATAPQITHDIELKVNRSSARPFTVQSNVDHVMLRIPRPASTLNQGPRLLEVISPQGQSILKRSIEGWAQGGNSLHLVLPRRQLTAGEYLLVIRDPAAGSTEASEQYAFSLELPAGAS